MFVTIEMTDEMVAAECVCSAIGGWVLSTVSMPCGVCSQPLTSWAREVIMLGENGSPPASKRQLAQM